MTHNDSQVEALARCPFCGGAGDYNTVQGWHGIGCLTRNCPGYRHALHHRTKEAAIAAWNGRTALSALTAGKVEAIPEGWKLVPMEPTREMVVAGVKAGIAHSNEPYYIYPAMLAASPYPLSADPESAVVGAPPCCEFPVGGPCPDCPNATLPHPALDRANAGERESEGSQKQEEFCDAHCCWSEHHPDCFRTLPAADPERREGADAAACGVPIPHTFAPPDADTDDSMEGGKKP